MMKLIKKKIIENEWKERKKLFSGYKKLYFEIYYFIDYYNNLDIAFFV
jgi:hypothetical protein